MSRRLLSRAVPRTCTSGTGPGPDYTIEFLCKDVLVDEIRKIPGHENYGITRDGRVWSYRRKKWLLDGYPRVQIGRGAHQAVHILVLRTFVGPCPEGCHENGVRTDVRLDNLRWDTRSNNAKDRVRHGTAKNLFGRGEDHHSARLTKRDVRLIIYLYRTKEFLQKGIADLYHVGQRRISEIVNRKTWRHVWTD